MEAIPGIPADNFVFGPTGIKKKQCSGGPSLLSPKGCQKLIIIILKAIIGASTTFWPGTRRGQDLGRLAGTEHQNRAQLPKFWLIENPFTMILRYACLKHLIIFSFNFLRCFAFSTVGIGPAIREKTERFTAFHRAGCISPMNVLRHQRSIRLRSDRVLSLSVQPATATEYRLDEPITETATAEFDSAALYSAAPGDAVLSLPLRIAGHDWQVVIYPSGQSVPPPPWLGWLASIDEALGPSNRRVGRVGVYLRFLAPHEDAFVDAVFQLQMVISVILQ